MEAGEDDLAAARRELREETGIVNVTMLEGFRQESVYFFRSKRHGLVRKTVVFFLGLTFNRDVQISDEHAGFEFLPYKPALQRLTFPTARQILSAAEYRLTAESEKP